MTPSCLTCTLGTLDLEAVAFFPVDLSLVILSQTRSLSSGLRFLASLTLTFFLGFKHGSLHVLSCLIVFMAARWAAAVMRHVTTCTFALTSSLMSCLSLASV